MFKSFTKSFKSGTFSPAPVGTVQPTVVGGAPDLHTLLNKAKSNNSVGSRIEATEEIRASIDSYSVSSIPEIWLTVEDMISSRYSAECRQAGIKLLISCIKRGNNERTTRMSFYQSLVNSSNLQDFDLQLEAIRCLTENGTNMADFFQVEPRIPDVLVAWLQHLAKETQDFRSDKRPDNTKAWRHSMEKNFHALVRFTMDAFRHNHSLFSDRDIILLMQEGILTCRKTSSEEDMKECLSLIDVIILYGFMPIENLTGLLEVLCGAASISSRAEQAWNIVLNLSKSYISNNTFACLCKILEETGKSEVNSNTMRGAARYLQRLIGIYFGQKREVEIPVAKVMQAYKASLAVDSLRLNHEICNCVYNLLENSSTLDRFTYDVWESRNLSPLEIIYRISSTAAVQMFAYHPLSNDKAQSISMLSSLSRHSAGERDKSHDTARNIIEKFKEIFSLVLDITKKKEFHGSKELVIDFFVDMSPFVDEKCALLVIDHFKVSHYCNPLSKNWIYNTEELLERFFRDMTWGPVVRQRVLYVVQDAYEIAKELSEPEEIIDLLIRVFRQVEDEPDNQVLETMLEIFEEISKDATPDVFDSISRLFLSFFPDGGRRKSATSFTSTGNDLAMSTHITANQSISSLGQSFSGGLSPLLMTTERSTGNSPGPNYYTPMEYRKQLVAGAFCRTFVNIFKTSAVKASMTYLNLITICKRSLNDPLSFIEAARLLCRLRATGEGYIYITNPSNMDGLAGSLGRNLSGIDDISGFRSTMTWWYPDNVSYLTEEDLEVPSWVLKSHSEDSYYSATPYELDISLWYNDIILKIIEFGGLWEIYSFVWAHFAPQLSNIQLSRNNGCDIHRLRQIICDQILGQSRPQVTFPNEVTKNDIKVVLIRTTSTLIAYHDIFKKRDEDYIVRALVEGMSTSEKAVVPCIHGLVVCCYELPLSIKKNLGQIFTKFQTKITNSSNSPHILEFLLSLSRLPSLTDNFTQDEYKRVFGMAIQYIQHAYDLASQKQHNADIRVTGPVVGPGTGTMVSHTMDITNSRLLSQYLLVLAYDVVATWFLTLRVNDRKFMAKFIIRKLILTEGGPESIDSQSLAYVDLISRFTYSNLDLTVQTTTAPARTDLSSYSTSQWVYGNSIVSIRTHTQSGESQITIRRPTGTSVINLKPDEKMIPGWLEESVLKQREPSDFTAATQRLRVDTTTIFTPNYFLLQLMVPLDTHQSVKPILLPSGEVIDRGIAAFDRTPVVDFHKIGVMYIAPGQHDELEILGNSTGSIDYKKFLDGIGKLVRLKDNRKIYTGGLDIANNIDGDYAYVWNDKITQLLFHTTTMMPPPQNPHDTSFASKKRHIGNDFVNIYFDESERPFEFETVKSQFNFINIVITPISCGYSRTGPFMEMDTEPMSPTMRPQSFGREEVELVENKKFYKVRALCKPGVPAIFAACHLKIVSENSLPVFVRNLAIIASKFAAVWNSEGNYISHWQYRLEQIETLRNKALDEQKKSASNGTITAPPTQQHTHQGADSVDKKEESNVTLSFLGQLNNREPTESTEKRESGLAPAPSTFSMDDPDGQDDDMPLLKHLDFSTFT